MRRRTLAGCDGLGRSREQSADGGDDGGAPLWSSHGRLGTGWCAHHAAPTRWCWRGRSRGASSARASSSTSRRRSSARPGGRCARTWPARRPGPRAHITGAPRDARRDTRQICCWLDGCAADGYSCCANDENPRTSLLPAPNPIPTPSDSTVRRNGGPFGRENHSIAGKLHIWVPFQADGSP